LDFLNVQSLAAGPGPMRGGSKWTRGQFDLPAIKLRKKEEIARNPAALSNGRAP